MSGGIVAIRRSGFDFSFERMYETGFKNPLAREVRVQNFLSRD
jgi:hypothetical protein